MLRSVAVALLATSLLGLDASAAPRTIYIVYGDMNGIQTAQEPYTPKRWRWLTAGLKNPGQMRFESALESSIRHSFRKVRKKGYRLASVDRIDADRLLAILADQETVGVFYFGHALADRGPVNGLLEGPAYLSVRDGDSFAPLDEKRIDAAKRRYPGGYRPSPSLRFLFTGACFPASCHAGLVTGLELGPSVVLGGSFRPDRTTNVFWLTEAMLRVADEMPTAGAPICSDLFSVDFDPE